MGRTRDQLKGDEVGLDQEIGSGAAASLKAFHYEEVKLLK